MAILPLLNKPQVQSITNALKNICRDYPAGGTILRELLQNADDAGASIVKFVLDDNSYETEPLLHPELAQYQGPALLAFNSAIFLDKDFESLSRVGDSLKFSDGATTGRFGRGFNSVYNWTDSPSIVSRDRLLILDPHHVCSSGGEIYDFVANAGEREIINHMAVFQKLLEPLDQPLDGTIIRIPMRTGVQALTCKISDRQTTVSEMSMVLERFADEFSNGGLVFMTHVTKISIHSKITGDIDIEICNFEEVVLHKNMINNAIIKSLNDKSNHKFAPWVAIAIKLSGGSDSVRNGALFTKNNLPLFHTHIGYDTAADAKIPVVFVSDPLKSELEDIFENGKLAQKMLCQFLDHKNAWVITWNSDTRQAILEYILFVLASSEYGKTLELLPFEDGQRRSLNAHTVFVHRNDFEADLLMPHDHKQICYRSAKDLRSYAFKYEFQQFDQSSDMVILDLDQVAFFTKVWSWVFSQNLDFFNEEFGSLWLLPATNGSSMPRTWIRLDSRVQIGVDEKIATLPIFTDFQFLDAQVVRQILQYQGLGVCKSAIEIIEGHILPAWKSNQECIWTPFTKEATAELMLRSYSDLSMDARMQIATLPIIPTQRINGTIALKFSTASTLIDPSIPEMREIFFEEEEVLPTDAAYEKFGFIYKSCGLKSTVDEAVAYDRARKFESSGRGPLSCTKAVEFSSPIVFIIGPRTESYPVAKHWMATSNSS
ncbi:hypothetical protein EYC80_001511 [Monilinia laxa]|uniref:Sacsin/Nov domain-containing protein n=1 Tax=Monilinia laxa TaxID=61186 RepID=A0A5N6K568_MONLA|nr:hypothetical protein EYC80_001511 [Monilinia laxa]